MTGLSGQYLDDALVQAGKLKQLADRAIAQVNDDELFHTIDADSNSIAIVMRHVAGNLRSRFTDFLSSDGEKPWRNRESEFQARSNVTRAELLEQWDGGWTVLFRALKPLTDEDLSGIVTIRGEKFRVHEALHRLLAHTSYHVGQIVYLAKSLRGSEWKSLSIPHGKSEQYNRNPTGQRPPK